MQKTIFSNSAIAVWLGVLTLSNAWGAESTIARLTRVGTTNAGDGVLVEMDTAPPTTCSTTDKILMLKTNTPLFSENLAVLLSAFHANSKVRLYTEGCVQGLVAFKSVSVIS